MVLPIKLHLYVGSSSLVGRGVSFFLLLNYTSERQPTSMVQRYQVVLNMLTRLIRSMVILERCNHTKCLTMVLLLNFYMRIKELHQVAIKLLTYGLLYLMTTRLQIQRDQHRQQQYHVKAQGKLPHILC